MNVIMCLIPPLVLLGTVLTIIATRYAFRGIAVLGKKGKLRTALGRLLKSVLIVATVAIAAINTHPVPCGPKKQAANKPCLCKIFALNIHK